VSVAGDVVAVETERQKDGVTRHQQLLSPASHITSYQMMHMSATLRLIVIRKVHVRWARVGV